MSIVNILLDKARETCSPSNDAGLAAALGVEKSAVSNWRHGRAYPNVVACEQIAHMIGSRPLQVIGAVNEARAISKAEKAVWRRLLTSAAAVAVMLSATTLPGRDTRGPQDRTQAHAAPYFAESGRGMHIMSAWRRGTLTLIGDVFLWLRWKFSGKVAGPHLEAMAA